MYINGMPFFVTISQHIGMIHCIRVLNKENKTIANAITKIIGVYSARGFVVRTMHGDNAFEGLTDWLINEHKVQLTLCGAKGHVPRVENAIKLIKERVRCLRHHMPFDALPINVTIEMVARAVLLINSFNRKAGVHKVLSPREIVEGRQFTPPFCHFGDLVMAYNTQASNDTEVERAFYALYIKPNEGGTAHYVYNMKTKQIVSSPKVIVKTMTDQFVDIVNKIVSILTVM